MTTLEQIDAGWDEPTAAEIAARAARVEQMAKMLYAAFGGSTPAAMQRARAEAETLVPMPDGSTVIHDRDIVVVPPAPIPLRDEELVILPAIPIELTEADFEVIEHPRRRVRRPQQHRTFSARPKASASTWRKTTMSTTITTDAPETITHREEPCLCAQLASSWCDVYEGEDTPAARAELAAHAFQTCPMCRGTGFETVPVSDRIELDLNEGNAAALFAALGPPRDPIGELPIVTIRRAIIRARNVDLERHARAPEIEYGKPMDQGDGVVEMRPFRGLTVGLTGDQLRERVDRLARVVEEGARHGATMVRWS